MAVMGRCVIWVGWLEGGRGCGSGRDFVLVGGLL